MSAPSPGVGHSRRCVLPYGAFPCGDCPDSRSRSSRSRDSESTVVPSGTGPLRPAATPVGVTSSRCDPDTYLPSGLFPLPASHPAVRSCRWRTLQLAASPRRSRCPRQDAPFAPAQHLRASGRPADSLSGAGLILPCLYSRSCPEEPEPTLRACARPVVSASRNTCSCVDPPTPSRAPA